MSEEDPEGAGPGPQPDPVPPAAAPEERPANMLGAVFLIGCGLCLLLVGGGCTTLLVILMFQSHGATSESSMLVISLALAGGGIFAIVQGVRMVRGRAWVRALVGIAPLRIASERPAETTGATA